MIGSWEYNIYLWTLSVDLSTDEFIAKCVIGREKLVGGGGSLRAQPRRVYLPLSSLDLSLSASCLPCHEGTFALPCPSTIAPCLGTSRLWTENSTNCEPKQTFPPLACGYQVFCLNNEKATKTTILES